MRFYSQAIRGQFKIVAAQEPIPELLSDPKTPQALKKRLELVLEARRFAEQGLHLEANGHYLKYADLERRFAVWNVFAAPEFSLTPKSWWYPVVGRQDYRGFFAEKQAQEEARRLRKKGFDVYVGGVTAYSTLGWFRDPILNTFIFEDEVELAELIFHELAHHRVFVPGDTDFNEAFATTVAEEGVRRWLMSEGKTESLAQYEAQTKRAEQFARLVDETRQRLLMVYDETEGAPGNRVRSKSEAAVLREQKRQVIQELQENYSSLRQTWGETTDYEAWFRRPINNAQLNTVKTYYHFVPAFRRLLQEESGDLRHFYRRAKQIGGLKEEERHRHLKRLLAEAGQ